MFFGKMRSLLNKLTVEKFDQLAEKLVNQYKSIDSMESLQASIELVHNKALTEPHFSAMYSDLCKRLNDNCPPIGDGKSTFRSVLLNQCQVRT
jgi:translation initiation factor 4G